MKRILFTGMFFVLGVCIVQAQTIWSNVITGADPSDSNPYTTNDVALANVSVTGISYSSGTNKNKGDDRFNTKQWNTASLNATNYISFTLTPSTNEYLHFENFDFNFQKSSAGPSSFAIRASDDAFVSDIVSGSISIDGTPIFNSIVLPKARFGNINAAVEFRIYAWGASNAAGTFSINDFVFKGTADGSLPVYFEKITGSIVNNQLQLNWATLSENNNDFFEIQVSKDGKEFITVDKIASKSVEGISQQKLEYSSSGNVKFYAGLFSMIILCTSLLSFKRNYKILCGGIFFAIVILGIACTKNSDILLTENTKIFVRIVQIDKDGNSTSSKAILLENLK